MKRNWRGNHRKPSTIGGALNLDALAKLFALTPEDAQRRRGNWDSHGERPLHLAIPLGEAVAPRRFTLPTAASSMDALRRQHVEDDLAEQLPALDGPDEV